MLLPNCTAQFTVFQNIKQSSILQSSWKIVPNRRDDNKRNRKNISCLDQTLSEFWSRIERSRSENSFFTRFNTKKSHCWIDIFIHPPCKKQFSDLYRSILEHNLENKYVACNSRYWSWSMSLYFWCYELELQVKS